MFLVVGGTGFLCGRVVDNVWGTIENLLLFLVVPSVAGMGYLAGRFFGAADRGRRLVIWKATGTTTACFYAGYAIGWLALWGYFGF